MSVLHQISTLASNPERIRQHEEWKARRARMTPSRVIPKRPTITSMCGPRPSWARYAQYVYPQPAGPTYTPQFRIVYTFPAGPYRTSDSARIFSEVCRACGVTKSEILSPDRFAYIVAARHMLFYRLRIELDLPYPLIGRLTNRDHTTVLHGVRSYAKRLKRQGAAA
jgi:hypothetical protein